MPENQFIPILFLAFLLDSIFFLFLFLKFGILGGIVFIVLTVALLILYICLLGGRLINFQNDQS